MSFMSANRIKHAQALYAVDIVDRYLDDASFKTARAPTVSLEPMHGVMTAIRDCMSAAGIERADFSAAVKSGDAASTQLQKLCGDFFVAFEKHTDPGAGKFTAWVCKTLLSMPSDKHVRAQDLYKIHDDLKDFDAWSARIQQEGHKNDIHAYDSFAALAEVLEPYQVARDQKQAKKKESNNGMTVIHDGPAGKILLIRNKAAAQIYGAGTRWCVSASDQNNMFSSYNSSGPLFFYILPDVDKAGRQVKYAGHVDEIFDVHDDTLNGVPKALKVLIDEAHAKADPFAVQLLQRYGGYTSLKATKPAAAVPAEWAHEYERIKDSYSLIPDVKNPALLENPDFILFLMSHDKRFYDAADYKLRETENFSARVVSRYPEFLGQLPQHHRCAYDVGRAALFAADRKQINSVWLNLDRSLQSHIDLARIAVDRGLSVFLLPQDVPRDRALLLSFIRRMDSTSYNNYNDKKIPEIVPYKNDRDFILAEIRLNADLYGRLPSEIQKDTVFVKALIGQNPSVYSRLSADMKLNEGLAYEAVWGSPWMYQHIPKALRSVPDIMEEALSGDDNWNIDFVLPTQKKDPDFIIWFLGACHINSTKIRACLAAIDCQALERKDPDFKERVSQVLINSEAPSHYLLACAEAGWEIDHNLVRMRAEKAVQHGDRDTAFDMVRHLPDLWPAQGFPEFFMASVAARPSGPVPE